MRIPDAQRFRTDLGKVLAKHASCPVELIFVNDVAQWAEERCGNLVGNPPATSIIDIHTKAWGVVVRRFMDEHCVRSVVDRICWSRTGEARKLLSTQTQFLRHLVLHELAHLENDWDQSHEDECDDWAFERLHEAP